MDYEEILDQISRELALRFEDPDDPALFERRQRLRALFESVPPAHVQELHSRLGERSTGDELSESFHGRLAKATRRELLKILRDRFPGKREMDETSPSEESATEKGAVSVRKGNRGKDVEEVQRALQVAGFEIDDDGKFGNDTEAAVRQFQRQVGLPDSGIVDAATRTALSLGVTPSGTEQIRSSDIVFTVDEVTVLPAVEQEIERYASLVGTQLGKLLGTTQDALSQFSDVMKFGSTSEASPDLFGTVLASVFRAVAKFLKRTSVVAAVGLAVDLFEGVGDELSRVGKARIGAAVVDWIREQRNILDARRRAWDARDFKEDVIEAYLNSADKDATFVAITAAMEQLAQLPLPTFADLETGLLEEWINAHFTSIGDDAEGCVEIRHKFEDNIFDFVSCEVKAPEGKKLADAFNDIFEGGLARARRPIDLRVRKKVCFRTEGLAGGTAWYCGWLDADNQVIHRPPKDTAAQALDEKVWRLIDRFKD